MKKKLALVLGVIILVIVVLTLTLKKDNKGDIMDGPGMVNETSSYSVEAKERGEFPGEDIYLYDEDGNLVLSLEDKNQPQYLFALYENYLILDSGTSASKREILAYDIKSGDKIFETDYFPGEFGLVLNDNIVTYYKEIPESLLGDYTLPECENEYDNGYVEKYSYTIGDSTDSDLGDIKCVYFE